MSKVSNIGIMFSAIAIASLGSASGSCREIKETRKLLQQTGVHTGNRKTRSGKNQRQRRKNARRRWAAGDRTAFRG